MMYQYFSVNFSHKRYGRSVCVKIESDGNVSEDYVRDYVIDHELMDVDDVRYATIEEITEIEYKFATV